jgi:hypothetical protein
LNRRGHFREGSGDEMIWAYIRKEVEPESRELTQDFALIRDALMSVLVIMKNTLLRITSKAEICYQSKFHYSMRKAKLRKWLCERLDYRRRALPCQ